VLSAGVLGTVKLLLEARTAATSRTSPSALGRLVRTNSEAILGVTAAPQGVLVEGHRHHLVVPPRRAHPRRGRALQRGERRALPPRHHCSPTAAPAPRWWRWLGRTSRPAAHLREEPLALRQGAARRLPARHADARQLHLAAPPTHVAHPLSPRARHRPRRRRAQPLVHPPRQRGRARLRGKVGGVAYSSIPEVLFDVPTTAHILGGAAIGPSPRRASSTSATRSSATPGSTCATAP
jgi:cholesterol oxidase